jgi:hypothetical protein
MGPGGFPIWVSDVEPGSTHDLTAAREHVLGALYAAAGNGLPTLADPGYEGAGKGVHTPVKQPADGSELDINTRTRNALLRATRDDQAVAAVEAAGWAAEPTRCSIGWPVGSPGWTRARPMGSGTCSRSAATGPSRHRGRVRADELTAGLPRHSWQRLSADPGRRASATTSGPGIDTPTARTATTPSTPVLVAADPPPPPHPGELAFYRCPSPEPVPLRELSASPGAAGPSRKLFRPAKAWSAWTNTRSAAGPPGSAGPCSP